MLFEIQINTMELNMTGSEHLCPVCHFALQYVGRVAAQYCLLHAPTWLVQSCYISACCVASCNCLLLAANIMILCRPDPEMAAEVAAAASCLFVERCDTACPAVSCLSSPGFVSGVTLAMQVSSGCGSYTISVQEGSLVMVSYLLHAKGAEHCFMMLPLHLSTSAEHRCQKCNAGQWYHCASMCCCSSARFSTFGVAQVCPGGASW